MIINQGVIHIVPNDLKCSHLKTPVDENVARWVMHIDDLYFSIENYRILCNINTVFKAIYKKILGGGICVKNQLVVS